MAAIDSFGVCLISDVSTNSYKFHVEMKTTYKEGTLSPLLIVDYYLQDVYARTRWSVNIGEPLCFVKYDRNNLSVLDAEKETFVLKGPLRLEKLSNLFLYRPINFFFLLASVLSIDVCPNDGNLLAIGGWGKGINIYDRRESKIVMAISEANECNRTYFDFLKSNSRCFETILNSYLTTKKKKSFSSFLLLTF